MTDIAPRSPRRSLEDDLEELIRHTTWRERLLRPPPREDPMWRAFEVAKTVVPWLLTAAIFLWHVGGQWNAAVSANQKVEALRQEIKHEFVTKDEFRPTAEDVREIKRFLMEQARR